MIVTSPDINVLDFKVDVDLSITNPTVKFTNLSAGPNLAGVKWLFHAFTPNGVSIHPSSFLVPDITGEWATFTLPKPIPQPGGNIVWGAAPYRFVLIAKDVAGTEFTFEKSKEICKPSGNKKGNNFGAATFELEVKCDKAKIYAADTTNYAYNKNLKPAGTGQRKFTLIYPRDENDSLPTPFVVNGFSNAFIPISYSSPGYEARLESIVSYDLGDNVTVKIKYKKTFSFPVQCNVDLCELNCAYTALIEKAAQGCDDEINRNLAIISAKMQQAIIGKMQPLCKIDVGKLVAEIKDIGGFDCNCDCGNGVVPILISSDGSGSDCNAVLACIGNAISLLNPGCLSSDDEWAGLSFSQQMQLILDVLAELYCPTCSAPFSVIFNPYTRILEWRVDNNTNLFTIGYKTTAAQSYTNIAGNPVRQGGGLWRLDLSLSGVFNQDLDYLFRVQSNCSNNTNSGFVVSGPYSFDAPCLDIVDFEGEVVV